MQVSICTTVNVRHPSVWSSVNSCAQLDNFGVLFLQFPWGEPVNWDAHMGVVVLSLCLFDCLYLYCAESVLCLWIEMLHCFLLVFLFWGALLGGSIRGCLASSFHVFECSFDAYVWFLFWLFEHAHCFYVPLLFSPFLQSLICPSDCLFRIWGTWVQDIQLGTTVVRIVPDSRLG